MLVEHNIDPELVAELEFIVVAVVDIRANFRVVVLIGDLDAERPHVVCLVPCLGIGHLGKVPDFHALTPFTLRYVTLRYATSSHATLAATNCPMRSITTSGRSICG